MTASEMPLVLTGPNHDDSAWMSVEGDWTAAMFDGPVAQVGDVVEIVCTQAGDRLNFKLRVVRKTDTSSEV